MSVDLSSWALPQLQRLLPIDEQSLKDVLDYSVSLSKEAGAEHLKNLLGDSPAALEFISSFNSRRTGKINSNPTQLSGSGDIPHPATNQSDISGARKRQTKKSKPPVHHAGPVRRPENYGDLGGGYTKSSVEEDYMPKASRPTTTALSNALSLSQEPAALQVPNKTNQLVGSPASSRERSPAGHSKLPPSASGSLISDLPNVKSKAPRPSAHNSGASTPQKATTTSSINDLTSAIASLELSTNPSLSSERRSCQCNASIHPLFETAPNCLSCGKIICALEGLQPCSFCDSPILSREQVQTMIRTLKEERGQERMSAHNAAVSHSGRGTPVFASSRGTPESSGDEASTAASKARAHRDKLLAYQRENVQRTRVHDEAADYDMTVTPGATQWMSPVQRAAALKKQQKYLRELEETNKPEWEKKKTVLSMSIRNGKLIRTYEAAKKDIAQEVEEADDMEDQDGQTLSGIQTGGGLSQNPLLFSGGLIRPIWRAPDDQSGKEKGRAEDTAQRPQTWRRVQDENEDNEQWILDGGTHGYEDGSNQEHG